MIIEENTKLDIKNLNEKQLYSLLYLGEIDACTYQDAMIILESKKIKQNKFQIMRNYLSNLLKKLKKIILR